LPAGSPLATVTPKVLQQFTALHPYENPPLIPNTDVPVLCITPETLSTVLTRFRRGTAPGLTGCTYKHILDATRRPSARRACVAFLNNMLAGRLPRVPELLDSDGLLLRKRVGGIRPIASEVWLRLAALCAAHECSELGPRLAPLQLGVGIPGGAEGVRHALRSALDAHPDHLLLSLDCKNAFNSVSRQAVFHAAQEHDPSLSHSFTGRTAGPCGFSSVGRPTTLSPSSPLAESNSGTPSGPSFSP
jgi:hypothetical protein